MRAAVFLALSILLQTAVAALGKYAAISMPQFTAAAVLSNRWYLLSLVCLALHAVTWQLTLARLPLSFAYTAMTLLYVNTLVLSAFVFHEQVTRTHVFGAALIVVGVALLSLGRRTSDA